jgi:hypothetical protein
MDLSSLISYSLSSVSADSQEPTGETGFSLVFIPMASITGWCRESIIHYPLSIIHYPSLLPIPFKSGQVGEG